MQLPEWEAQAITITHASVVFNRSRVWLHELVKKYDVPTFKIGNTVYAFRPRLEEIVNDKAARR